jgi:hypothetical protein
MSLIRSADSHGTSLKAQPGEKTNSAMEYDIQFELMHADFYFRTPSEPGPPPIKEPPPEGPAEPGYPEPDPDPTEPSQI